VLQEVQELCDELAVLVGGSVVYRGKLSELTAGKANLEAALRGLYTKGAAL
jgi:ABC-type Na+ transport system ATPase subunit NatA